MPRPIGLATSDVRRQNLSSTLKVIHRSGAIRRAEITERTGLNKSTVLSLIDELSTLGLVRESTGRPSGSRGRPSPIVHPNSSGVVVIASEIAVDFARISVVGLGGVLIESLDVDVNPHQVGPTATAQALGEASTRLVTPSSAVVAAATAVHGIVTPEGHLVRAPNLEWTELDMRSESKRLLGQVPVFFGNDADLGALGEHRRGVAQGHSDVLYLSAERGIGGGLLRDGQLQQGRRGFSTEVGHMVVRRGGRRCACGSRGCLETEVGESALLRKANRRTDARRVIELARRGDRTAVAAVRDVADWLGFALGNFANLFDPDLIVIGGFLADIAELERDVVVDAAVDVALVGADLATRIQPSTWRRDAALIGAAELAFDHVLGDPASIAPREHLIHDLTNTA